MADGPVNEKTLLDLEHMRCDALLANDAEALDAIYTDDFVYVHSSGRVEGRADYLATLAKGENPFLAFRHSGLTAAPLSDAGLLTGTVEIDRKNGQVVFLFVEVWVRRPDGWQLKFQQNTKKAI